MSVDGGGKPHVTRSGFFFYRLSYPNALLRSNIYHSNSIL